MDIETQLLRIDEKLSRITQAQNKKVWGSVRWVKKITGWSSEDLRHARLQNLIEWRDVQGHIEYNINSIPERLLVGRQSHTGAGNTQ